MVHYPPMANSPATYLAAAINSTVTTISVVDASKLPAAPNLATIGTGETAETILYTGKSGNDLTGVTRGFEVEAREWNTGVQVARYLTAHDISELQKIAGSLETHEDKTASQAHSTTVKEITDASYTLLPEDNGAWLIFNSASAQTVIIPTGLGLSFTCACRQKGAGQVTIEAGSGVSLNAFDNEVKSTGQNAVFGLFQDEINVFVPYGNLEVV